MTCKYKKYNIKVILPATAVTHMTIMSVPSVPCRIELEAAFLSSVLIFIVPDCRHIGFNKSDELTQMDGMAEVLQ